MGNTRSSEHSSIDWLAKEPLAPHIDAYMLYLANRDYAANTFSNYLGVVSHFAQWIHSRRLRLQSIDEALVAKFLDKHLPRCHCSGPVQRDRRTLSAALGHLLAVLRARGAIAPATLSSTPVSEELRRYDAYMDHVRGLAPKTRETALRIVGRLLTSRFGDAAIDIAAIEPDQVRDFFAQQAKLYSKPASAGTVIASLRGYFRYRASLGDRGAWVDRRAVLPGQLAVVLAAQDAHDRGSRATGRLARQTGPLTATRRRHRALRPGSRTSQRRDRPHQPRRHRLACRHDHAAPHQGPP